MTSTPDITRRGFLLRAGIGGALVALPPELRVVLPDPAQPRLHPAAATTGPLADSLFSGLQWRMLGPFRGGRVDAVSGVPGRPNEFYFGRVNGGVWKTIDAGRVWEPVFDAQPVASIGALAVAPSAPDVIYVGSGESTLRDSTGYGNGMYKSTDAGKTWTHIGLDDTQHIGKIAVDPTNPDIVFVAAIGHYYGSSTERGVFRSTDGGQELAEGALQERQRRRHRSGDRPDQPEGASTPASGTPGGRRGSSTRRPTARAAASTSRPTAATTWQQLTQGLPPEGIGRTGIAVAPSQPRRVYAVRRLPAARARCAAPASSGAGRPAAARHDAAPGRLLPLRRRRGDVDAHVVGLGAVGPRLVLRARRRRSERTPTRLRLRTSPSPARRTAARRGCRCAARPAATTTTRPGSRPTIPNTMIVASDQGAIITRNATADDPREVTWSSWLNQPTAQIYHLSVDYRFPYWVTGAQQDSGAVAVRSRGKFGEISMRDWEPIGAGRRERLHGGGSAASRAWSSAARATAGTWRRTASSRAPPIPSPPIRSPCGATGRSRSSCRRPIRTRCTTPISSCSRPPTARARGRQISPDLTRPDPGVPPTLDAAATADTGDNGRRGVIYTIAPSPMLVPLVWIGTDDGVIQVTTNDGKTWQNVTPPAIARLEPGDDDRGVALRFPRGVRRRRPASAGRLRAVHLPHAGRGQDLAAHHAPACRPASTCTR